MKNGTYRYNDIYMRDNPQYFSSLTAMRGIAALWVVFFHMDVIIFYRDLGSLIPHDQSGIITRGYLWVDFFFILSGFIITHVYGGLFAGQYNHRTIFHFIWARFSRIYPLHIFTLALLVLFSGIVPLLLPEVMDSSWYSYFDWAALPSNIMLTNAMNQHVYLSWNIVSWSIGAEWWTYVAGISLLTLLARKSVFASLLTIIIAASLLILMVYWYPGKSLDITFDYGFFRCLFEFAIGVGLYQLFQRGYAARWLKRDEIFLLIFLAIVAVFHWGLNDLWVIPLFGLMVLALGHNKSTVGRILNMPILSYLGKISYSVYLMHGVWFMVFWFLLPWVTSQSGIMALSGLNKIVYCSLFLALTIISAGFTYRYIEVKHRRYLRQKLQFI
ncbi:MAG: hypothetical protein COA81_12505 [Alphaproteobacteria bacterium]|nr:MAG: hypothetical protein COA81_12505 [Alphaproteobacteria bacterium]